MSKFINDKGRFVSHQTPKLPEDSITLSFRDPEATMALQMYAMSVRDDELASDIKRRLAMMIKEVGAREDKADEDEKVKEGRK